MKEASTAGNAVNISSHATEMMLSRGGNESGRQSRCTGMLSKQHRPGVCTTITHPFVAPVSPFAASDI